MGRDAGDALAAVGPANHGPLLYPGLVRITCSRPHWPVTADLKSALPLIPAFSPEGRRNLCNRADGVWVATSGPRGLLQAGVATKHGVGTLAGPLHQHQDQRVKGQEEALLEQ